MPERLECEVLQKARYINTLTFTFTFTMSDGNVALENGVGRDAAHFNRPPPCGGYASC